MSAGAIADHVALLDRAAAFLDEATRVSLGMIDIALRCRFAGNSLRELDLFLNDVFVAARGSGKRTFSAAEGYRRACRTTPLDRDRHTQLRAARSLQNRLAFTPLVNLVDQDGDELATAVIAASRLYRRVGKAMMAGS